VTDEEVAALPRHCDFMETKGTSAPRVWEATASDDYKRAVQQEMENRGYEVTWKPDRLGNPRMHMIFRQVNQD